MEHNSPGDADDRPFRIPTIIWILGVGLVVALLAIFVFDVAVNTVVSYAFFLFMVGGHFFHASFPWRTP